MLVFVHTGQLLVNPHTWTREMLCRSHGSEALVFDMVIFMSTIHLLRTSYILYTFTQGFFSNLYRQNIPSKKQKKTNKQIKTRTPPPPKKNTKQENEKKFGANLGYTVRPSQPSKKKVVRVLIILSCFYSGRNQIQGSGTEPHSQSMKS